MYCGVLLAYWRSVAWRTWTWNLDLRLTADRTTTTTIRVVKQTTA